MKGLCLCWLCPRRPLWLLTVQRKVNSDCVSVSLCSNLSECTNGKKDYSEKEHSNSDSICYKKSLTWSSAYVQPHFALNVNLMHRWSRHTEIVKKKKKKNVASNVLFICLSSLFLLASESIVRECRWLFLAVQVKEIIHASSISVNAEVAAWTNTYSWLIYMYYVLFFLFF